MISPKDIHDILHDMARETLNSLSAAIEGAIKYQSAELDNLLKMAEAIGWTQFDLLYAINQAWIDIIFGNRKG
ncbi:MAG: hypothetical protein HQK97_07155 [Nitrospirae bacterium]|nr:hypothetical protein [Nitrospirota bacterium]